MWDPSISLGSILTFLGFIVSLFALHINNVKRFENMSAKFDLMFDWWQAHILEKDKNGRN
jgi:hypothetical protein